MKEDAKRAGIVYFRDTKVGIIRETDEGYEFSYDSQYLASPLAEPVSLTMPLTQKLYQSTVFFPFFDGLIPEGWLLSLTSSVWKVSVQDRMGLLLSVCKDPIGAVSVQECGDVS